MKPQNLKVNIPTIFVIFGVTGDLVAKKIAPALFHLFNKQKLPNIFKVVGFSRSDLSNDELRARIRNILSKHDDIFKNGEEKISAFLKLFVYQKGEFQTKNDYTNLSGALMKMDSEWGVCTNKLFYLAVPPQLYEDIFNHLAESGLTKPCGDKEGWTRIIVEKPFGKDLSTAQKLDELLGRLFKEEQIYRIDHYLAKEMLQNILSFRFSNTLFEQSWNNKFIESIEIKLLENIGVEDRGSFYDRVGALRDVGQNHLLQMLALITMEYPQKFNAKSIRNERAKILKTLKRLTNTEIKKLTKRAQYEGYKAVKGVGANSDIETYFKIQAFLGHPRWNGIPITMESGKRMRERKKEIIVTFRHPTPCLCPEDAKEHYKNKVIFSLEPEEEIKIRFWSKKPGLDMRSEEREFKFLLRGGERKTQYVEEYEKLLLDCIAGDQTLFVSTEEVREMWKFIDPIIEAWRKNLVPLKTYKQDRKEIGIVGLGKMGSNMAKRLSEKGWSVKCYDRKTPKVSPTKLIWLMVPHKAVDGVIDEFIPHLKKGNTIIDGGNSFYKDSVKRHKKLKKLGIHFLDVGVSGGPEGARNGASLMIGGEKSDYEKLEHLWQDLAVPDGYGYMGKPGAGHFVKMAHNGIEYGMMQALAEGFAIMKKSRLSLDLKKISEVYNHGSVIESRLTVWLKNAFEEYGENLDKVSGSVAQSGEGRWTVEAAKELGIPAKIIEDALKFRLKSQKHPSYTGKILSALRNQFGGHEITKKIKQ